MLGGGPNDDALLIGPFLDWWEKRTEKRDSKRITKAKARAAHRAQTGKGESTPSGQPSS
jgi:hypothetical protein